MSHDNYSGNVHKDAFSEQFVRGGCDFCKGLRASNTDTRKSKSRPSSAFHSLLFPVVDLLRVNGQARETIEGWKSSWLLTMPVKLLPKKRFKEGGLRAD
jgi:hypothetical protein